MEARGFFYGFLPSLLLVHYLCGCLLMPVGAKPIIHTPDGATAAPPTLPEVGSTTEREVAERYRDYNVDVGVPSLFWARMDISDSILIYEGFPERHWENSNMVAVFDSNHVVRFVSSFPDARFPEEIASMVQQGQLPALNLSAPIKLVTERMPEKGSLAPEEKTLTLALLQSSLFVTRLSCRNRLCEKPMLVETFDIPREQICCLTIENLRNDSYRSEDSVGVRIRIQPKKKFGAFLTFVARFPDALTFARWLAQTDPSHS